MSLESAIQRGYTRLATAKSVAGAITLGTERISALTRYQAHFLCLLVYGGLCEATERWAGPLSGCDDLVQSATLLPSPEVGGLRSKTEDRHHV